MPSPFSAYQIAQNGEAPHQREHTSKRQMYNYEGKKPTTSLWQLVKWPVIITGTLFALQVIVQPLFLLTVPTGYGAALAIGGSVGDTTYMPGPHFKLPWQSAILMKLWTVAEVRETTPADSNNQPIGATVVPQIWIEPSAIPALARNYHNFESLMKAVVDPQISQATRAQTSLHTPEELIWERPPWSRTSRKHCKRQSATSSRPKASIARNPRRPCCYPHFAFSEPVRNTLEAKAESQVRTHTANAQATIRGIEADMNGQVTEITADGDAEASQIIAKANAYKVAKVGEAMPPHPMSQVRSDHELVGGRRSLLSHPVGQRRPSDHLRR
jgi:hypothetical protein